jgi:hypothetical protein
VQTTPTAKEAKSAAPMDVDTHAKTPFSNQVWTLELKSEELESRMNKMSSSEFGIRIILLKLETKVIVFHLGINISLNLSK